MDKIPSNNRNETVGWGTSIVLHLLLLLLIFLFPSFSHLDPPPQIQGILVSFGERDAEFTELDESEASEDEDQTDEVSKTKSNQSDSEKPKEVEEKSPNKKAVVKEILETDNNSVITATNKAKALEVKLKQEQIAAKQKQEEEYEKAKSKFGNMFGKGESKNDNKPKGEQEGKPNAEILEGVTKGSGRIGGGLKERGLEFVPKFKDNSQKEGRVVIKVCVDSSGKVISTNYTQSGSTTSDSELIAIAIKNAEKYVFSSIDIEEQCGKVTVDFKLQ